MNTMDSLQVLMAYCIYQFTTHNQDSFSVAFSLTGLLQNGRVQIRGILPRRASHWRYLQEIPAWARS